MHENFPLISIIVPVYKVEKYLPKCIESILDQTFTDWELLLIDDGSPDKSGEICDEYALKDSRIKVFHKENVGVSSARNLGLKEAIGDYVMFVDSDDWISEDCLEVCVKEIVEYDLDALQFCLTSVISGTEKQSVKTATKPLSGEQYIQTNSFNVCAGGGIYKRNIIEEYNLRFPTQLKLAEDQIFTLSFFRHVQRIKYLDKSLYYYLQRADSAVHTSKSSDMLLSCKKLIALSKEWPASKSFIDKMIVHFIIGMIRNNDVSYKILKSIYKSQNVDHFNVSYRLQAYFHKIARINFYLACWFCSFYLKFSK